jgi:hypothetical protein
MGDVLTPQVEEMAGCACFRLRKAARALTQFYDRALKAHRLRVTQLPILVAASQHVAVPLAKLAQELGDGPYDAPQERSSARATPAAEGFASRGFATDRGPSHGWRARSPGKGVPRLEEGTGTVAGELGRPGLVRDPPGSRHGGALRLSSEAFF